MVKKFLFVISELNLGGIETLSLRMSNWLIENNFNVHILAKGPGDLLAKFSDKCIIKFYTDCAIDRWIINEKKLNLQDEFLNVDCVHAFSCGANIISLQLLQIINKKYRKNLEKVKYIVGAYHPKSFMFYNKFLDFIFTKPYLKLNDSNKLFMSADVKLFHERYYKRSFGNSFILPLPITNIKNNRLSYCPQEYKIVSIGRFTPFKTYNLYMIDIIERIRELYPSISYYMYGYGEEEEKIKQKITNKNLGSYIKVYPPINYEDIESVLSDAYCFVGVGTAAIEAASIGVPTIVSIVDKCNVSHGYLHNLPLGNCGEYVEGMSTEKTETILVDLINSSLSNHERLQRLSKEYVKQYDLKSIMRQYIEYIERNNLSGYVVKDNLIQLRVYNKLVSLLSKKYTKSLLNIIKSKIYSKKR